MKALYITFLILLMPINMFAQWFPQNSGTLDHLIKVQFVDENIGWVQDNLHKKIFKTTNGGSDWSLQTSLSTSFIFTFFFLNENTGWYTARQAPSGSIYKTTDGGDTWQEIYIWQCIDLNFVKFIDESKGWSTGYVCLEGGKLFQTNDGGDSWINVVVSQSYNGSLYNIDVIDELNIIVTGDGVIFKTSDGGNSWIELPVFGGAPIMEVQFMDVNLGWVTVFSSPEHQLYKTSDGGLDWMLQVQAINSFYFSSINNGWYVLYNNIYHTTSGGNSWALQNSNTNNNLHDIFFLDNNNGWAVGDSGTIFYTPNGGLPVELVSFTAELTDKNVLLSWITATETNNQGFAIERINYTSEWGKIGFVEGKGTTTKPQFYSFTDNNVTSGKYKYRLKQIDYDGTFEYSKIVEVEVGFPTEFSLLQNYPNPFNPSTIIQYAISSKQFVTIKVYDVLGKEIATLVNEEKPAGEYEVEFNAVNLPSGIYFYRIQAGDFIKTRKMVLLR